MISPDAVIAIGCAASGVVGYLAGARAGRHTGRIEGRTVTARQAWESGYREGEADALDALDAARKDDPEETEEEAATQAWIADLRDDPPPGPVTQEFERIARLPDHIAADPARAVSLKVADARRWSALIEEDLSWWQEDIMADGDAMVAREMAEMTAELERMSSKNDTY